MPSRIRSLPVCLSVVAAIAISAAPGVGQVPSESSPLDGRRGFRYEREGRVDPFRSPIIGGGITGSFGDFELRGTIEHENPSRSIAILTRRGTDRPVRVAIGQRVGDIRIVSIGDGRVDVIVDELGVRRRETIVMRADDDDASPGDRR